MESLACLDGQLMPASEARVPIWDRGFLFGDAVYEVFRLYGGRCWLEHEHLARLRRSLAEMRIVGLDLDGLAGRIRRTVAASGLNEATVYVQITRGVAPRRHVFPDPPVRPTEVIVVRAYDDAPTARSRESGVAAISHPDLRWKRCDVKSTNLLANVLAAEAAHRAGCHEAILVDADGQVSEATHSSVLWVRSGRLEATPEGPGILPGTTRQSLLRIVAEAGLTFAEAPIILAELLRADEVLFVGTTIEVLPVVRVDDAPIADGRPGPAARRLQAAYRRTIERWLAEGPTD
ncbi:MAG TPA: aminotransferase class IV [Isosphaeraceae bacterium]|jgi:D-alanine transaminase